MDFVDQIQEIIATLMNKSAFRRCIPGLYHKSMTVTRVISATYDLLNYSTSSPSHELLMRNPLFEQFVSNLEEATRKLDKLKDYVNSNEEDFLSLENSMAKLVTNEISSINKKLKHYTALFKN